MMKADGIGLGKMERERKYSIRGKQGQGDIQKEAKGTRTICKVP